MSLFILVIIYLFGRIGTVLEQLREKPPHFCEDLFSLKRDPVPEPEIMTVRS